MLGRMGTKGAVVRDATRESVAARWEEIRPRRSLQPRIIPTCS